MIKPDPADIYARDPVFVERVSCGRRQSGQKQRFCWPLYDRNTTSEKQVRFGGIDKAPQELVIAFHQLGLAASPA
ncbi:TPA: hypothetical protein SMR42_004222 [Pseudomonas putida]|nr:hypothetical protein [Pseudomonas putida]